MPAQSRSLSTRFMTLAYDWESLVVIALGRSRKGNLFSVAEIFWVKKIQLLVGLSMPLSLLELAWLDIWPGLAWLAILSCLVWICQIMVIARSVLTSIPPPSRLNPISIPSQSHLHPVSIPSLCPFRFPLPSPFPLLGRSGFCSHSRSCSLVAPVFAPMVWPRLAWPGARTRSSLRSCRAFQRGDFASKTLQVCCQFLILPRGGLAVLTVVAASPAGRG